MGLDQLLNVSLKTEHRIRMGGRKRETKKAGDREAAKVVAELPKFSCNSY